jgi:5-methylcytosine-specific restriction endonuclease McrA
MRRIRRTILEQQGGRCLYCRSVLSFEDSTLDHIIPLSHGGARQSVDNVVVACFGCNARRGNERFTTFLATVPNLISRAARTASTARLDLQESSGI